MKMSEIYKNKGFDTFCSCDGRNVVKKEILLLTTNFKGEEAKSFVGFKVDAYEKTLSVWHLKGAKPEVDNLFYALLADRDVRRLIKQYQDTGRKYPYKVWRKWGQSYCMDYFITIGKGIGDFLITDTKKLLHVSMEGKLNQGFGDTESSMYIGDFVELCVAMGLTGNMNRRYLKKLSGVKYILPKLAIELSEYSDLPSNIL